jgi:WD40 repeat protein
VSDDGKRLATGGEEGIVRLWNTSIQGPQKPAILGGWGKVAEAGDAVRSIAFSRDGNWLVAGYTSGKLMLWNLKQEAQAPQPLAGGRDIVYSIVLAPEMDLLMTASADSTIRKYKYSNPLEPPVKYKLAYRPTCMAVNGHRGVMVVGSDDGTLRVYHQGKFGNDPEELKLFTPKAIRSLAMNREGTHVAIGSSEGRVMVLELITRKKELFVGHNASVNSLAFNPNGSVLATASSDKTIRLWDIEKNNAESIMLTGHDSWVWGVAFSPDGRNIYSGGSDQRIRTWKTSTAELASMICPLVDRNLSQQEWDKFIGPPDMLEEPCVLLPHPKER